MTDSASFIARIGAVDHRISARCVIVADGSGGRATAMAVIRRVSQTGSYGVGWVALFAVVVTLFEGWPVALVAAACVLGTLAANSAVKVVVRRPRPASTSFGNHATTYSMPSAHTSMAVVGATIMTMVAPGAAALWWGWTIILAVSRVLLGMHYIGDVLAGAVFGAVLAWLVVVPVMHVVGVA
jgi:undecaprenyl-diphosphatase